jgi:hypothetical protein
LETLIKDIYWLAGMLEGKGSFYTYTKKNLKQSLTYPEFTFQSVDRDITRRVARITKSNISAVKPYGSSKQLSYKIRLCSTRAIQWMMTIYPIMGIRRKARIKNIISVWKSSTDGRKTRYKGKQAT